MAMQGRNMSREVKHTYTSEIIANTFVRNYVRVSIIMARVLFYYMVRPTRTIFRYLA
jgi:hypothetical protein